MKRKYNRDDIDEHLSMGENALLYYDNILEKNALNRIVISTILRLHKKGYAEVNKSKENELVIKIKNGTKKLRISEAFIFECLKVMDSDSDNILTLNELRVSENNVIATHKKNIKELIIQEAIADELINPKKFKKKRRYFFRTLEILIILLIPILLAFINPIIVMLLIISIILFSFLASSHYLGEFISYSKDSLKKLKNKLLHDEMMKYSSKNERKNIMIEFILCIAIYCIHFYILRNLFTYTIWNVFIVESFIFLIIAIVEYIKFLKMDVYTNKAILYREKLKGLEEYLKEYSLIENRKAIEVYLWEDYLAFSVLLGINNAISKEFSFNLSDNDKRGKIQYDYYENRYFYINDKDEKIYVDQI